MALPTWIADALRSDRRTISTEFWRCVEAQHLVSTLQLVDTLHEQRLLEDILDETKPAAPPECRGLHYLYMTPFRYGLYPKGSRFRRAGRTPGVCYVAENSETAVIETAFHLLLFYAESPATPFPSRPSEHTAFDAPVKSDAAIDLAKRPFDEASALWTHPSDYEACQSLEESARAAGIDLICYASVRDPMKRANGAILDCRAFAAKAPCKTQTWRILFNDAGVHLICEFPKSMLELKPEIWRDAPELSSLRWFSAP